MRPSKESLVLGPGQGWAFSQDRSCRLDPSREMRDLFPLPCPPKVCQEHRLSRRSQQRFDRKQKILADVQSAVNGLNWMHGFSPTFKFDSAPDPMQKQVLERMVHLSRVAAHQGSGPAWKPEAALRELLRGKSEYESPGMPISLARFDIERISLPTSLEGVPHVLDVLPEEAHHFLKSPEHMLRSEPPTEELITPYWDPILRNSKAAYKSLIKKLHAIGYLRFTRKPLAKAGLFFVHKSDRQKIRLIVDARQANQLFGSPPGVELCTSEGFARIEIEVPEQLEPGSPGFQQHLRERGLVFGLSDVKDCFHRLRQPHWLSRYFAWEEIPVSWVDDIIGTVVEGERVKKGDRLFPCPASLCMGFSWSLFFAQRSSEHLMSKVPSLVSSKIVSDRSEGISFKEADKGMVRHYVYVDNLGVISQDEAVVKRCLAELGPAFDDRGLILHPGELQADDVRALGCQMRSDLLAVRVTPERYWKLRRALEGLLRRKKVSGRILEVVLGHITFCCLCNRQLLCIFSSVYKYIRRHYFFPSAWWPSVRRELEAFRSLMIFLQSDWWRPWNTLVSSSDSSLEGYGVSTSFWDSEEVAACGRRLERSRFRRAASTSAREHALTSAGFVRDEITEAWRRKQIGDEEFIEKSGWEVDKGFEEIPSYLLAKSRWEPKIWGRWHHEGNILELEGRALVKSLRRIALSVFGSDIRQLLLVDNMSVALSFDRFRSRSFKLLKQIRRFSAYLLSRNIHAMVRWIPSEFNSSDEPSRFYSEEQSKLLTHLLEDEVQTGSGAKTTVAPCQKDHGAEEKAGLEKGERCEGVREPCPDHGQGRLEGGVADQEGPVCPSVPPDGCGPVGAVVFLEEEPGTGRVRFKFEQPDHRGPQESSNEKEKEDVPRPGRWRHGKDQSFVAGGESSGRADAQDLQRRTIKLSELCPPFGVGCGESGILGSNGRRLYEPAVHPGLPSVQGRPACGRHPPLLPGFWANGEFEVAKDVESFERLPEAVSRQIQIGLPASDLGCRGQPDERDGPAENGCVCYGGGFELRTPFRAFEDEGFLAGEAFSGNYQQLEPPLEPRGFAGKKQNRRLRRLDCLRFSLPPGLERPSVQPAEKVAPRGPLMGFRLQRVLPSLQESDRAPGNRQFDPLPDPALRAVDRSSQRISDAAGGHEKRSMEVPVFGSEIRKGCSIGSHIQQPADGAAKPRQAVRRGAWGYHARYPKTNRVWRKSEVRGYFMDLFSGKGGVSRAIHSLGFEAKQWDVLHGPLHDLTDTAVVNRILREIKRNRVKGVMMAPVCTSFSRARDRTKVIRTHRYPWGIPHRFLTEKEISSIRLGNACFRSCLRIINELNKRGIPWILENPWSSRCWSLPPLCHLISSQQAHLSRMDFCQHNTPWKKPTGFLHNHIVDSHRLSCTCQGQNGVCSRTGRRHWPLTGSGPGGKPWTVLAQPYPPKVCKALAHALTSTYHALHSF